MLALKAGSALSNPEDEIADTARQNVRFGAAHFDRLSDLDWRTLGGYRATAADRP